MMPETDGPQLTGAERRNLRRKAHALRPVVQVGDAGVTEGVLGAIEQALEDHELIKLRLAGEREDRRRVAEDLAARTASALAGMVGRVAVFYRPARDPERRRIDPSQRSA